MTTNIPASTETATATTNSRNVCDLAGNCVTMGPISGLKVDKKAPSITLTMPTSGASYAINQRVPTNFVCADGGSGVAACTGTVANGANIDTTTPGAKTFTVQTRDNVSNTTAQSTNDTVGYAIRALCNQTQPYNSGSTVGIKL